MNEKNQSLSAFKQTSLGPIPLDWNAVALGKISEITSSKRIMMDEYVSSGIPFYRSKEIIEKINGKVIQSDIYIPEKRFLEIKERFGAPEPNQILITAVGSLGLAYLINESDLPFYFKDGNLIWLKNIKNINIDFLLCYFKSGLFKKTIDEMTYGSSQKALTIDNLNKFLIPVPSIPEQKSISKLLSTWDNAIKYTQSLIQLKERSKQWLIKNLLMGRKRLQGFNEKVELKIIGHYLTELSERNSNNKVSNVLSVTNSRGFINQAEQFDRVVASEDSSNYKIVRKGQFAYNPSRVNVGSLDLLRTFEVGILSPMYVVFETKSSELLPEFLYYHLKSQWFNGHIPMFVQGSVRDSLSFDGLCGMKFFIPSLEEQMAITNVLQAANKEIQILQNKLEVLNLQKKGLMQQLLTGKKRIKL